MIIKTRNGEIDRYPYAIGQLRKDNPNISFPTNISENILNLYDCYTVEDTPKPLGDVVIEIAPVYVNGVWSRQWDSRTFTPDELESYRAKIKGRLAAIRYDKETNHPVVDTSRSSQAMINGAWTMSQINPDIMINFKNMDGTWSEVGKSDIHTLALVVGTYVQKCFDNEMRIHALLDQATSKYEIDSVQLLSGWEECIS